MKQGIWLTRIVMILLSLAVVAYIGFSVWDGLASPFKLVVSYSCRMDDGAELSGVVVREEEVITGRSALSQVLPDEGEKVAVGATVAVVFDSADALADRREAERLELQLDQLTYAMGRNDAVGDAEQLDAQLVASLAALRAAVSSDELGELENEGLSLRSIVVKRVGELETNAESLAALQAAAADIQAQLDRLAVSTARQTHPVTVGRSGVFSGLADGYETLLTPRALEELTPSGLEALKDRRTQAPADAVGKLITNSTWYFAAPVDEAAARRLEEGKRYTVDFTGDFDQQVSMKLERLGPKEEGVRLAVFSSDRYLSQVTLTRFESATLVFESYTGIRVPDRALRVLTNEDGTTTLGVYALVGRRAEFKPVEIIREGEDFYLVKGTASNRKVLRAGDVIILSNQELYDGKVVAS